MWHQFKTKSHLRALYMEENMSSSNLFVSKKFIPFSEMIISLCLVFYNLRSKQPEGENQIRHIP